MIKTFYVKLAGNYSPATLTLFKMNLQGTFENVKTTLREEIFVVEAEEVEMNEYILESKKIDYDNLLSVTDEVGSDLCSF